MKKEAGVLNALLIPVIVLALLVAGLAGFSVWAYGKFQDYKNNSDQKSAAAVQKAEAAQKDQLTKQFLEQEKQPNRTYHSPSSLGTVSVKYPKTWSVYVAADGANGGQYDAYFNPIAVQPVANDQQHPSALHVTITQQDYGTVLSTMNPLVLKGNLKAKPIKIGKKGKGMRYDGSFVDQGIHGSMVVFPQRDKTVEVFGSEAFSADFNKIILPSLTYIP